jgi:hypothetical protein
MPAVRYSSKEEILEQADPEIQEILGALIERALDRGDGIAVYENHDLGHYMLGHKQFVTYGSRYAQLEAPFFIVVGDDGESQKVWFSRAAAEAGASAVGKGGSEVREVWDRPPHSLPDIGSAINWRYQLIGYYFP